MKKTKKQIVITLLILIMLITFTACGSDKEVIKGTYQSDDGQTMIVCDEDVIFVLHGDDINASNYSISGNTLTMGDSILYFNGEDKDVLCIGEETFTKRSRPLSVRWKLIKWASKTRIEDAKLGIFQWLIIDPIFTEGGNLYGRYARIGSWMALISVIIVIALIGLIISKIKKKK